MSQRRPLDVIQVANPCPVPWDQMSGDNERRFCTHCQKHVHNLSAMTADQAERLVCESAGALCACFARDPATGSVITLDYEPRPPASRLKAMLLITALVASGSIAASWAVYELYLKPQATSGVMMPGGVVMGTPIPPPIATPAE